ncbi:hypothetical protein LINPERPRIM_LOCUS15229 [Linum perenne]
MHTLIEKLDNNIKWWSMYACLLGFFYFFSSPFLGKTIRPSYSNFSRWYIAWILVAALYHLPSFQSMGVDMRMNLSLFMTIYVSSIVFLLVFHVVFLGLWYIGLVSRVAAKQPELFTIFQNCAVLSVACCVFYSHCGNQATMIDKSLHESPSSWFPFRKKGEINIWLAKFIRMNELKDQVCSSWFAPVGSASDYPLLSKWVIYGEIGCTGNECAATSDGISPIYSLWATFIGLYIANYVVERSTGWALTHPLSVKEYENLKKRQMKPDFLDMVPWYSGTSADLFKTVFDLLVSVTVFVGRFDMRMMQAAMNKVQDGVKSDHFYDHLSKEEDLWFDFMADTGDGGNSTYSVARLLAQPSLRVNIGDSVHSLPRAKLLLVGGDLAYPNPSSFTYERRLFCPFEYALQPPPWYKEDQVAAHKPELPHGVSELKQYDGPQCFAIPGNHDWFDGLHTFMRYICHKSWLGGWIMPQKKSYFALQLPKRWWVFGLDLALHNDIDVFQFKFFTEVVKDKVGENDSVIIITHEPNWLLDWYWNDVSGKNVSHLIHDYLKGRCKLRMAGDLHHYMRHSHVPSDGPVDVQHLIVNGCGGAFLHPTHVFGDFKKAYGTTYDTKASYPSLEDSSRVTTSTGSSGYHTLFEWYRAVEREHFPDPTGLRDRIEQWTFGLYPACIKYLMSAFDVPEVMAVTRSNICKNGMEALSRGGAIIYYASVFLYFWVPKEWQLDPYWDAEPRVPQQMSHQRKYPSKWSAASHLQDPINTVKIVDHFVIRHTDEPGLEATNGSVSG